MPKRKHRLYSLFSVETLANGRKRYHRLSDTALPLDGARRWFQNSLLRVGLGGRVRELRPVPHQAEATLGKAVIEKG